MNRLIILVFAFGCLLVAPLSSRASDVDSLIDRYEQAVNAIKSYDVMFNMDYLIYPSANHIEDKANSPKKVLSETLRDVFGTNRGRRLERNIDTELHSISVIDWAAASSAEKPLSMALNFAGDGIVYFSYFNPNCEGRFLTELLRARDSTLRALRRGQQVGIEVDSNILRGPIRVWLDQDHGYMPKAIEVFVRINGKATLLCRTVSEEFIRQDGIAWVPTKGSYNMPHLAGPATGRNYTGRAMAVDVESSSWNSVESSDLFAADSLPSVNHEQDGLIEFVPDDVLAGYEFADKIRHKMNANVGAHPQSRRLLFVCVSISVILFIPILIIWKKVSFR